jgi:Tol biopolymer transport system component
MLAAALVCAFPSSATATAPGRNGKIAYYHQDAGQPRAIHVINPDGSGEAPFSGGFFAEESPAWSPAGDMLAFRCWPEETGGNGICTARADGTDGSMVASQCCGSGTPTWSPDGTDIAWFVTGARFVPPYLWRAAADGSDPIQLREGAAPDWSPYGPASQIAFVREGAGGYPGIHVMEADNSFSTPVVETPNADNSDPSWSPDGTIAFQSNRDGNSEIYITDANGSVQTRLTNNAAEDVDPEVSPDGLKIVFASNRGGDSELYIMNIDGTGVTQLTDNAGSSDSSPDWQALPEAGYARPKGATPLRVPLVPAFDGCTAPNRTHGPPLAFASCNPPTTPSRYATIGTGSTGHVRLDVVGQPGAWEVRVSASLSDVIRRLDSADALGSLDLTLTPQITDDANGPRLFFNGTTTKPGYFDNPLHVDMPCNPTADPAVGSTCSVQTSLAALTSLSGERAVVELDQVTVYDGGDDGYVDTRDDNTPLVRQGVFVP